MRTVGVLSAEARGTGVATIDWSGPQPRLIAVQVGADDPAVLAELALADKAAVDCPLGWPEPFVELLVAHRAGRAPAPLGRSGLEWRRTLSRRATDLHVARTVPGAAPLAVGADRIAAVAMRAAGLLAALADGRPVDRGRPGLARRGLPSGRAPRLGARKPLVQSAANRSTLDVLVGEPQSALPSLDWQGHDQACRTSDDAFDAVVCAVLARAAHAGLTAGPSEHLLDRAAAEVRIHLPAAGSLQLIAGPREVPWVG